MNEDASTAAQPAVGWRLKLGVPIFVLSILLPVAGIPLVATLGLSGTMTRFRLWRRASGRRSARDPSRRGYGQTGLSLYQEAALSGY